MREKQRARAAKRSAERNKKAAPSNQSSQPAKTAEVRVEVVPEGAEAASAARPSFWQRVKKMFSRK